MYIYIYNTRRSYLAGLLKREKERQRKSREERKKKRRKDLIYLSFGEREVGRGSGSVVATTNYPTLRALKRERKGEREGGGAWRRGPCH